MGNVEKDILSLNNRGNDQADATKALHDRVMLLENSHRAALSRLAFLEKNLQDLVAGSYGSGPTVKE